MVRVKRAKRKNIFMPTDEEVRRWNRLPRVQEKCKQLWLQVLIEDAELAKLCRSIDGQYKFDPLAMTLACIGNPSRFENVENAVWRAAHRAAQAQLTFLRRAQHYTKKHKLNILSIRATCDPLTLPP